MSSSCNCYYHVLIYLWYLEMISQCGPFDYHCKSLVHQIIIYVDLCSTINKPIYGMCNWHWHWQNWNISVWVDIELVGCYLPSWSDNQGPRIDTVLHTKYTSKKLFLYVLLHTWKYSGGCGENEKTSCITSVLSVSVSVLYMCNSIPCSGQYVLLVQWCWKSC